MEPNSGLKRRAQRFVLQFPIRYRSIGEGTWFEGKTENISRSGVLFRTDYPLEPNTAIQMSFDPPRSMMGVGPGKVFCRGIVVRTVLAEHSNPAGVAATIRTYRFARGHHGT